MEIPYRSLSHDPKPHGAVVDPPPTEGHVTRKAVKVCKSTTSTDLCSNPKPAAVTTIPEEDPKARGTASISTRNEPEEYLDIFRMQKVTIINGVCITPLAPIYHPFVKLVGLDSSMDKKYLLHIFDPKRERGVIALQVVRDDGEPYAFIQYLNLAFAKHAMKKYREWMPRNVEMCWFRDPNEEEGHRDKHPKNKHHNLLLPHVPRKQVIYLHMFSFMPSIERVTVKDIKHGGTCAKIYGRVVVFDDVQMHVLYRRGPSESDERRRGDDLKLTGPHRSTHEIWYRGLTVGINLFEDRGDGQERVFARAVLSGVGGRAGIHEEEVEGDGGVVSVVFAAVLHAVWAVVRVSGLPQNVCVYGCIKASREISGKQSEFVMLARSCLENAVRVGPDGFLPLDRSLVIACKRDGLTISLSLNLCGDDGEWCCAFRKDVLFEAVFREESQAIDIDMDGSEKKVITVSLTYGDTTKIDMDDDDDFERVASGPDYDEVMEELTRKQSQVLEELNRKHLLPHS